MFLNWNDNARTTGAWDLFIKNKLCLLKKLSFSLIFLAITSASSFATVYYVSNSGNDSNSGTSPTEAWQTLKKVNSFSPGPGDQILFKRGDSWVGTIEVKASGTNGSPILYGAYGSGNRPVIYGSETISGWTKHSGNIFKATFSSNVEQLFVDGERLVLARYPNSGYTNDSYSSAWNGATSIGRKSAYIMGSSVVSSSSSIIGANGTLLTNKLAFLDSAGEWYYDSGNNTVYLWSPGGDSPDNYIVRGSTLKYGVNLNGNDYITIENINIRDSYDKGIYGSGSNDITVNSCDINYIEQYGIYITSAKNSEITNNIISNINRNGIWVYSANSLVEGNSISNIGLFESFHKLANGQQVGTAIMSRANDCTINYNTIEKSGYCGINFWGKNTMVKYNYINNAMYVQSDGGAIYTYNGPNYSDPASAGSEVHYNIIQNSNGSNAGYTTKWGDAHGIYMDDKIHDVSVKYNTVTGCLNGGGIFLHIAGEIDVQYNTVVDCAVGLLTGAESADSYYYNNIVYAFDTPGNTVWWTDSHQRMTKVDGGAISVYNNNKFIHRHTTTNPFNNSFSFSEWKAFTSQDANSTFDDSALAEGETEVLFLNKQKQAKSINLGSSVYRDIDGNKVSGTITLQPFTSKILIKTTSVNNTNQSPEIQGQVFEINSDIPADGVVGQVTATDPDQDQLEYTITGGNTENLFYINTSSGEILAKTDIMANEDKSVELVVTVTDNAASPLSASAIVTINIVAPANNDETNVTPGDLTAPVISDFSVPETASSPEIPVLTLEASDNTAITGYLITESENTPAADDQNWSASVPESYTFTSSGSFELFAWAKDEAGNVSAPATATIEVILDNSIVEYVTICEGEDYLGWMKSGIYEHSRTTNELTSENLIENSDFTSGSAGWRYWGASGYKLEVSTNNDEFVSAPASLQVYCKQNSTNNASLHLIVGDNIPLEEGKTYEFSFYAKATKTFRVGSIYAHEWKYPWGKTGIFKDKNPVITESWARYNLKFIATTTTNHTQIRFYLGNSLPVGESLFLDDVLFYESSATQQTTEQNVITYLTVNPIQYSTETITITEGENYQGWTDSGQYERTLTASTGCDSVVTTILVVESLNNKSAEINSQQQPQINQKTTFEDFIIYPNPANSYVHINFSYVPTDKTTVEVINNSGEILFTHLIETTLNKINLNHLSPGLYFINLRNKHGTNTQKLIIK
ncbi:T9SS type A sorting domain-containing protein [Maribellus comscasis]|uniref:T9SS type A sorting domain-containing protein n=1 Tax=Maribellus comscasis TaxID=2681766 RepID=A0A6I6JRQ2_9BACT|nr:right-handed parallel beta-helix repeat-containing protein [Maribellus comscasis]QGY43909.1 T9SS type A sorting domain-containing protein [Maribellus comscasis]